MKIYSLTTFTTRTSKNYENLHTNEFNNWFQFATDVRNIILLFILHSRFSWFAREGGRANSTPETKKNSLF